MTAFYIIIAQPLAPSQPSQNRTIPCFAPSHLPPLLKVRCCRPKKFGRLPEGLPHHHPSLAPTLPKPHHPLLCTITLASLVKGRWIDGKAQALILLHFACDTSTFLICQTFCRQDGGIASQPSFACTNPPKTAPSLALHHHTCLPCQR